MNYQVNRAQPRSRKFKGTILSVLMMMFLLVSVQATFGQSSEEKVYTVVDQQPEFQGGYDALMGFIQKNMRYPANAQRMGIAGTVYLSFVVAKDGSISEVKTIRGISDDCDKEAMRVVNMMPRWTPGKQNNEPVYVRIMLPIKFRLANN